MSSAREIAAKLSKAQREAVLSGGYNDDNSLRGRQRPMFYHLSEIGLFASQSIRKGMWNFYLTPLGLEVRSILQEEKP